MASSILRECYCREPHGEPGSTCWTCHGRVRTSSGSDDHSSQVERIYVERSGPAFGLVYGGGTKFSACTGPGGYAKAASSYGGVWAETLVYGGDSSSSAYAGPDGITASAGLGGHAVAMYGSGGEYEARMVTPGGDIIRRHRDGTIKVDMREDIVTRSDENYRAVRSISEDYGTTRHDVGNRRAIKYKIEKRKAIEYSEKKQEGAKHGKGTRKYIM